MKKELSDEQKKEINTLMEWAVKENISAADLFKKLMELSTKYHNKDPLPKVDPTRTIKGYNVDTFEPIYED